MRVYRRIIHTVLICLLVLGVLAGCARQELDAPAPQSLNGPNGLFITALAENPRNPRILYAGTLNGGVLESTDSGATWSYVDSGTGDPGNDKPQPRSIDTPGGRPDPALSIASLYTAEDGHLFAATLGRGVCIRSPSSGDWDPLDNTLGSLHFRQIVMGGERGDLYAGAQDGVYFLPRSTEDGLFHRREAWQKLFPREGDPLEGTDSDKVLTLFVSDEAVPRLYVGTSAGFFRSTDGGQTWSPAASDGINRDAHIVSMAVDPNDVDHVVVSTWDERAVYVSQDGGVSWQESSPNNALVEVLSFSGPTLYAVTYGGEIFGSIDGGIHWENNGSTDGVSILSFLETSDGRQIMGTDGQGILYRASPAAEWAEASITVPIALDIQTLYVTGDELYAGTSCCGVYRLTSEEWQILDKDVPRRARNITALAAGPGDTLFAGTYGEGVYSYTVSNRSSVQFGRGLSNRGLNVLSLVVVPFEEEIRLLAGTEDGLYRLEGDTWVRVNATISTNLIVDPRTETLFATSTNDQLYTSTDGGISWQVDQKAPAGIQRLVLASATGFQRLIQRSAPWTLFAQLDDDTFYYLTAGGEWQTIELERDPENNTAIFPQTHLSDGFLFAEMSPQRESSEPTSSLSLVRPGEDQIVAQPMSFSISVAISDPRHRGLIYLGTTDKGVHTQRLDFPSNWDFVLGFVKQSLPFCIPILIFVVASGAVIYWRSRPPQPVAVEMTVRPHRNSRQYLVQIELVDGRSEEAVTKLPASLFEIVELGRTKRRRLSMLRDAISSPLSLEEIRMLCFDLDIDYEDLPTQGKNSQVQELVRYFDDHGRIPELMEVSKKKYPHLSFANIPPANDELAEQEKDLRAELDRLFSTSPETRIEAIGDDMFTFLFDDPMVQAIYSEARGKNSSARLDLRLNLDETLVDLPWEMLHNPGKEQFLACSSDHSIVRMVGGIERVGEEKRRRRIDLLLIIGSSQREVQAEIDQEVSLLEEIAETDRRFHIDVVSTPTMLQAKLQNGYYPIVHIVGGVEQSDLLLENGQEGIARLNALHLWSAESRKPNLVFLSNYEEEGRGGIPALAPMLARKGIPLVLAFQYPLPLADRLAFTRSFYESLMATDSVEDAAGAGRRKLFSVYGVTPPRWAIPFLLIRSSKSNPF